jgi:ribosomal protein S12 methylthiotransferase accessory factor
MEELLVAEVLQWNSAFHVQVVDDNNVVLIDECEYYILTGKAFALLAPSLTGEMTVQDLMTAHAGQLSPPEIYFALTHLKRQSFVVEAEPAADPGARAYWNSLKIGTGQAHRQLESAAVRLQAVGAVVLDPLVRALSDAGVSVRDDGELLVVVTDDYMRPELEAINAAALRDGRPWLLVKTVGTVVWAGPLFRPGTTGCWKCLAQRLASNRQVERFLEKVGGRRRWSRAPLTCRPWPWPATLSPPRWRGRWPVESRRWTVPSPHSTSARSRRSATCWCSGHSATPAAILNTGRGRPTRWS